MALGRRARRLLVGEHQKLDAERPVPMGRKHDIPEWVTRGKTIRQLIQELESFDDLEREVRISLDYGDTHKAISIIHSDGEQYCVLINSEDYHNSGWQDFMNEGDSNPEVTPPDGPTMRCT